MILFLYGPDDYHRQRARRDIVAAYTAKHSGLTIEQFDGEQEGEWERVQDFARAQSLFDPMKMAVLRRGFSLADANQFGSFLKNYLTSSHIHILLEDIALPRGKVFLFLQEKPVIAHHYPLLTGAAWQKFVRQEATARGVSLSPHIQRSLRAAYGEGDCCGVTNALDVFALSLSPAALPEASSIDFFQSLQALARGELSHQLPLLEIMLAREDAAKTFNVLAYSVSPHQQIHFADYDAAIKSGRLEYEEALLNFLLL